MCGGGGGGYSARDSARDREAARREAEAERIKAEQTAQATSNAATAARRVRARANSLMTSAPQGAAASVDSSATAMTGVPPPVEAAEQAPKKRNSLMSRGTGMTGRVFGAAIQSMAERAR